MWKTGGVTDNKSENMRETIFGAEMKKIKLFCDKKNQSFLNVFSRNIFRFIFVPKIFLFKKRFLILHYMLFD